jgi:hypothetical protein
MLIVACEAERRDFYQILPILIRNKKHKSRVHEVLCEGAAPQTAWMTVSGFITK